MKITMFLMVVGIVVVVGFVPAADQTVATTEEEQVVAIVPDDIRFRSSDENQVITKKYEDLWIVIENHTYVVESVSAAPGDNFADGAVICTSAEQILDPVRIGRAADYKN